MKTTVISSFKGRTAKTSTTLHLGSALAKFHKKWVLLIDFDSQANLHCFRGYLRLIRYNGSCSSKRKMG